VIPYLLKSKFAIFFELIKLVFCFIISFHLNMGSIGEPLVNPGTKVILSLE
jgi:hypothetical protein